MLSHFRIPGTGSCLFIDMFLREQEVFSLNMPWGLFMVFPFIPALGFHSACALPSPASFLTEKGPGVAGGRPLLYSCLGDPRTGTQDMDPGVTNIPDRTEH